MSRYRITSPFTEIKLIEYLVKKSGSMILSSSFTDTIVYELEVPEAASAEFIAEMESLGQQRIRIEPQANY